MPRGVVRGDGDAAEANCITVLDGAIDRRWRKLQLGRALLSRIVPALDQGLVAFANDELVAGLLLEFGRPARVV
jgi:hypothetical protein